MSGFMSTFYSAAVAEGRIDADPAQERVVAAYDALSHRLAAYRQIKEKPVWRRIFGTKRIQPPRGLYVIGEVGRGKTMLMDMFYDAVPVRRKRRVHFHHFMADVHQRIHAHRMEHTGRKEGHESLQHVADALAKEAWLLCFDEFQVTDIADAMILGRLFERLFAQGVVVVATSNVPLSALYRDGLNRVLFLPFIRLLNEKLEEVALTSETDYRRLRLGDEKTWLTPLSAATDARMDALFLRLAGANPEPARFTVQGRTVHIPKAGEGVARFNFNELCARPLGAADFLGIAEHYHTVMIDHIPRLNFEKRNETKRFIVMIDAFYDRGVKLVASAEAPPDALVSESQHAFEFQRTASRLIEMQSHYWWERPHGRADRMHSADTAGLIET